jgi:hypothetical protein
MASRLAETDFPLSRFFFSLSRFAGEGRVRALPIFLCFAVLRGCCLFVFVLEM